MGKARIIIEGIYIVGGPDVSRSDDAASFIINFGGELVMIDAGAGGSSRILQKNIEDAGLDPGKISTLILTHNHIDHIGSAPYFRTHFGCKIVMHELDADAVEEGDSMRTAASCYGTTFSPMTVDRKLKGGEEILRFGGEELHCLHTPGHTPGSISIYLDRAGKRILFGQDIHGPFLDIFMSDINHWKKSMEKLIALEADILCEGHFGIFQTKEDVKRYIERYLKNYR
ncbi:MAG TPA: MBL fold metallo-hydrolase [Syntrophales bacterium]|nr:MBL fold metallo-hydrolase [Syntrophales bacterium]